MALTGLTQTVSAQTRSQAPGYFEPHQARPILASRPTSSSQSSQSRADTQLNWRPTARSLARQQRQADFEQQSGSWEGRSSYKAQTVSHNDGPTIAAPRISQSADSRYSDSRYAEPQQSEPQPSEPRYSESQYSEPAPQYSEGTRYSDDSQASDPGHQRSWGAVRTAQAVGGGSGDLQLPPPDGVPGVAPKDAPMPLEPSKPDYQNPQGTEEDDRYEQFRKKDQGDPCAKLYDLLTPITSINTDVRAEKGEFPNECPLFAETFQPRHWLPITYTWKASALCHKPLYFEDVALERYGHTWGVLQPAVSGAHFFAALPLLPYKMGVDHPCDCIYALGYYRPGDCAPYHILPFPISPRGAVYEGMAATGLVYLLP